VAKQQPMDQREQIVERDDCRDRGACLPPVAPKNETRFELMIVVGVMKAGVDGKNMAVET